MEPSSPCPAAVALSWLVPRVSGQGQGEGLEAGAFAICPSCSGPLLLGADEKSPRLERTTKQPLPSSLGSRELWSQAGSRCEAALAGAAGAGPQLLPPSPHPGVSLQPWSCPPPSQWGSGAASCIPALCKQHPCLQRLLRSPLSWGKSSQFWPDWRRQVGTPVLLESAPTLSWPTAFSVHPHGCWLRTKQPHQRSPCFFGL